MVGAAHIIDWTAVCPKGGVVESHEQSAFVVPAESPVAMVDPDVDRELRLAVTMNGGVSLAVYIGGVAHEFDRLTRGAAGYGALLAKFGYASRNDDGETYDRLPIIDVITGTSAGGINAAALALAQANANGNLDVLKGLWIQSGQIGDLMREPFRAGPASVMKGDDYFYPQIRAAFRRLVEGYERKQQSGNDVVAQVRPVDLTIPTTLLTPIQTFSVDDLGTGMVQPQHAGLFHFRGGTKASGTDDGPPPDVFSDGPAKKDGRNVKVGDGKIREIDVTVEALALAARASAGFPGAFEPAFIPVRHNGTTADDRPDMAYYADWEATGKVRDEKGDLSRFAIDGGVLANTPTRPALSAIRRQEVTETMVRRVLVLVHPHAEYASEIENVADDSGKPPTLVGTLAGVLKASGSVGSRTYVEEIRQHNDLALRWRDGREATMVQFSADTLKNFIGEDDDQQPAWQLFRRMRLRRGAYVSAHHIREEFSTPFAKLIEYAAEVLTIQDATPEGLSFLPKRPPKADDFTEGSTQWPWGLQLAVGVASQATDLLRNLINARADIPDIAGIPRTELLKLAHTAWRAAVNGGIELDRIAEEEGRLEAAAAKRRSDIASPDRPSAQESEKIRECLKQNLIDYSNEMLSTPSTSNTAATDQRPRGERTITTLRKVATPFLAVIDVLRRLEPDSPGIGEAAHYQITEKTASLLDSRHPLRGAQNVETLLKRMVQVEIVSYLTAEQDINDASVPTAPIEFAQLSAHIEQHFAPDFGADDKLAGMSLNRFGAFLKRAWRANDWIWGRLDAAKILMLVILTPEMIRGLFYSRGPHGNADPQRIVDSIAEAAFTDYALYTTLTSAAGKSQTTGKLCTLRSRAVEEVRRAVAGNDEPMVHLASLAAYGLQIEVAVEDVPWLATTIHNDQEDGATGSETAEFLNQLSAQDPASSGHPAPDGYQLLTVFVNSRIGQEAVAGQMPSDLMIRTAATAAATAVTALSSEKSGLAFAGPVTKFARGMVALPYWVLIGLSSRGRFARTIATLALTLGVSLTALSLLADLPGLMGKLLPTVGIASLVTVLVFATMRTRSLVHGAALLGLFIPLIAYATKEIAGGSGGTLIGEASVGVVSLVVLLIWVVVVANFAPNTRSPLGSALRAWDAIRAFCRKHKRALGGCIAIMAVALLVVFRFRRAVDHLFTVAIVWLERHFNSGPWTGDFYSLTTILLLAAVGYGCAVAYRKSRWLLPSARSGLPKRARISDPAGLATAWSPIYGAIYVILGVMLVPTLGAKARDWSWSAALASVFFGLFFCLVAVNAIPHMREKKLVKRLAAHFGPKGAPQDGAEFIRALNQVGDFSSYLTSKNDPSELTRHGRRVMKRVHNRVGSAPSTASADKKNPNAGDPQSPGPTVAAGKPA